MTTITAREQAEIDAANRSGAQPSSLRPRAVAAAGQLGQLAPVCSRERLRDPGAGLARRPASTAEGRRDPSVFAGKERRRHHRALRRRHSGHWTASRSSSGTRSAASSPKLAGLGLAKGRCRVDPAPFGACCPFRCPRCIVVPGARQPAELRTVDQR